MQTVLYEKASALSNEQGHAHLLLVYSWTSKGKPALRTTAFPGCFNSLWAILAVVSSQGMLVPICLLWEVNSSHEWGPWGWGWSSWAQEPMVSVLSCLLCRCLTLQKGDCVLADGR